MFTEMSIEIRLNILSRLLSLARYPGVMAVAMEIVVHQTNIVQDR